ncbi:MAG: hypothetical protein KAI91_01600, partial [Candidatus Omnitrophica bacterium]|nr:hypothetical protein [Candidatus Omnitrophota bacterium]
MKKILLVILGIFFLIPITFSIDKSLMNLNYRSNNVGSKPDKYRKTHYYQSKQPNDFSTIPVDKKKYTDRLRKKSCPNRNISQSFSNKYGTKQYDTKTITTGYTKPSESMITKDYSKERDPLVSSSSYGT